MALALLHGTKWDLLAVVTCVVGMSTPYLAFVIFGQYFLAYKWGLFPVFFSPELGLARCVVLPVIIGVVATLGHNLRFYRTVILDQMRSDYVRTAFAKGLTTRRVMFVHVLKNAMIPVITGAAMTIPYLFLGSLLLERFFGIAGLGYLMTDAIAARDYAVVNALTFVFSVVFVFCHIIADISYAIVDPRVGFD